MLGIIVNLIVCFALVALCTSCSDEREKDPSLPNGMTVKKLGMAIFVIDRDGNKIAQISKTLDGGSHLSHMNPYGFVVSSIIDKDGRLVHVTTNFACKSFEHLLAITVNGEGQIISTTPLGFSLDAPISDQLFDPEIWPTVSSP